MPPKLTADEQAELEYNIALEQYMKQMKINYPHGRGGLNPSQVIGPYSDALRFGERTGRKSGPQNMHRLSGEGMPKREFVRCNMPWREHLASFRASNPGLPLKESMLAASTTYDSSAKTARRTAREAKATTASAPSYLQVMLQAKKMGAASFTYKENTYVGSINPNYPNLGMVYRKVL